MAPARDRAGTSARLLDELEVLDQGYQTIVLDHVGFIQRLIVADLVDHRLILDEAPQCGLLVVDRNIAQGRDQQLGIREERRVTVSDSTDKTAGEDAVQRQLVDVIGCPARVGQRLGMQ